MTTTASDFPNPLRQVWLGFARAEQRQEFVSRFPELIELMGYRNEDEFNDIVLRYVVESNSPNQFAEALKASNVAPTAQARELLALYYLWQNQHFSTRQQFSQLRDVISPLLHPQTPWVPISCIMEAYRCCQESNYDEAEKLCGSLPSDSEASTNWGVIRFWVDSHYLITKGLIAQRRGDFRNSYGCYAEARKIAEGLDFATERYARANIAYLFRESGQPERALQIWTEPKFREQLRDRHDSYLLAINHLNASRCAIELQRPEVAANEVNAAHDLLSTMTLSQPRLEGYAILWQGELAVLEERFDEGANLIANAVTHFEEIDPPCHEGLMDAKIALACFALYQRDLATGWGILRRLLEEAEERGCLEARTRLLLLQTWFFISDDPPAREAFDDVLRRMHLCQNPAMMVHAFGNLLTYAIENLGEDEQAYLLQRIHNLKPLLEESCYDRLYAEHVEERFAPAMEERLRRSLEAGGVVPDDGFERAEPVES